MGEVYRARDTRLERIVAIKILPEHIALEPDARARFDREAKTISQLQHPNICTLHDVGVSGGMSYLVMEYLDGETLADRLKKGALPVADAVDYAIEIAEALDNAHRKGIVHRDLKPGNVMLVRGGGGQSVCKLLDFGLAKLAPSRAGVEPGLTVAASSRAAPLTASGTILGTFQYMAPEQIEGADADERTDIWAFGCVLYEMLTGRRTFEGKSPASLVAAILDRDPTPVAELLPLRPLTLDRVVRTCLAKRPDDRFQSAHDLRLQLRWIAEEGPDSRPSASAVRSYRRYAGWLTAIVFASVVTWWFARAPKAAQAEPPLTVSIDAPPGEVFGPMVALSPDGHSIAFTSGAGTDATTAASRRLWIRSLDSGAARVLADTQGAIAPFWSPDSRSVAFFADGRLKIAPAGGGTPRTVTAAVGIRVSGTWNRDDVILFSTETGQPLRRVSAKGGEATVAVPVTPTARKGAFRPDFLPDGRHFVFARVGEGPGSAGTIEVGSLDSVSTAPLRAGTEAEYADGYLLFVDGTTLEAQTFDAARLRLSGEPTPLVDLGSHQGSSGTNVSSGGASLIAFRTAPFTARELAWYDRSGRRTGTLGRPGTWSNPVLSPDGRSLAVSGARERDEASAVWVYDLARGEGTRVSSSSDRERTPQWSSDGRQIAFIRFEADFRSTGLIEVTTDGTSPERRLGAAPGIDLTSWSPDGGTFLFQQLDAAASPPNRDIVASASSTGKTTPFAQTRFDETEGRFSPDGRWVAYVSNESGAQEIYVQAFPAGGRKTIVSLHGGVQPRWRADGKELFYLAPDRKLMAVPVAWATGAPSFSAPVALFQTNLAPEAGLGTSAHYDVSADGQRFILASPLTDSLNGPITLLVNWTTALGRG